MAEDSSMGLGWSAGEDMNAGTGGKAMGGVAGDIHNDQTFDSASAGSVSFGFNPPDWVYYVAAGLLAVFLIKRRK